MCTITKKYTFIQVYYNKMEMTHDYKKWGYSYKACVQSNLQLCPYSFVWYKGVSPDFVMFIHVYMNNDRIYQ